MEVLPSRAAHFALHGSAAAQPVAPSSAPSPPAQQPVPMASSVSPSSADDDRTAAVASSMRCMICSMRFPGANELYAHMHEQHRSELVSAHAPPSPATSGQSTNDESDDDDIDSSDVEHLLDNDSSTMNGSINERSIAVDDDDDDDHGDHADSHRPNIAAAADDGPDRFEYNTDLMEPICELVHSDDEDNAHASTVQSYIDQQTADQLLQNMQIRWQLDEKTRQLFGMQQTHIAQMAALNALNRPPGGPFSCSQCDETFDSDAHLAQHRRNAHRLSKPFQCSICEKTFTHIGSLSTHLRIHSGEKPYKCTKCPKAFTQSSSLVVHMRSHATKKQFQCAVCDKGFVSLNSLQTHQRQHEQADPFACAECGISFRLSHLLDEHMAVHRNVKMYQCAICRICLTTASELVQHMKEHTGSRPYRCTHCEKSFSQLGSLNIHQRQHTDPASDRTPTIATPPKTPRYSAVSTTAIGDRPDHKHTTTPTAPNKRMPLSNKNWQCPVCLKMYSSSAYLTKHVESHGDRVAQAEVRTQKYLRLQRQRQRQPTAACPVCQRYVEGGPVAMLLHIGQEHGTRQAKTMRCWECQADFSDSFAFAVHLREHTERLAQQC